jgi:tRNA modification GTPase
MGEIELQLDYSEDEGEAGEREPPLEKMEQIRKRCADLAETYHTGRVFQQGVRVALAGRTNAGKSSLFNLFLKEDRAIVSEIHGTTRDYLEAWINIDGVPVLLYDTAGLRSVSDSIESEGIRRTEKLLASSDIVLYLVDSSEGIHEEDTSQIEAMRGKGIRCIPLWNKIDISPDETPEGFVALSLTTQEGFHEVEKAVKNAALKNSTVKTGEPVIDSLRQKELLDRAVLDLEHVGESIRRKVPLDMVAVDLRDALDALGEITGEITTADILETIFSHFCVGK